MNFKDPKNQISLFIVIIFLASSYLWYSKVYSQYAEKISLKEDQREKELLDLHNVKQKAATLDDLQREFDGLQLRYQAIELLLPERKEDESFLSQLHAAAQLTNSVVRSITPMGTLGGQFYETNTYSVEVESSYHGLGRFFSKVANFPFIVNVGDLEMKASTGLLAGLGSTKKDPNKVLIATFKMSTYNVKQDVSG